MNESEIIAMWSERAAIIEHDGGCTRDRAEFLAAKIVQRHLGLSKVPECITITIRERKIDGGG